MTPPPDVALQVTVYSQAPGGMGHRHIGGRDGGARRRAGLPHAGEARAARDRLHAQPSRRKCSTAMRHSGSTLSAFGGINYIEMFQYPRASVSQIQVADPIWWN